jgi:hypothetical protein
LAHGFSVVPAEKIMQLSYYFTQQPHTVVAVTTVVKIPEQCGTFVEQIQ